MTASPTVAAIPFTRSAWRRRFGGGMTVLAVAALAACGGGGGGGGDDGGGDPDPVTTVAVSGVVADGPLSGATVCYDLNDNAACDAGEPSATTDADGRYAFDIDTDVAGQHAVIASVPATAVDKDTGQPVGAAFTLKAPPSGGAGVQSVFVSPLTTLVVDVAAAEGSSTAEALAKVQSQLGLAASPLANFVAAGDADAAKMARTVNTVILEVAKLADAADVPAAQRQALIGSVTTGDLSTLAALVQAAGSATPAEVAAQVAATVIEERNLTPETVAQQAEEAATLAAPPVATPTGPFTSVRRFSFTDANNYFIQAFVGDNTPDANGGYWAHEARVNMQGGNAQPFNRNTLYWNKATSTWDNCAIAWQVVRVTRPQTATTPQESTFCGASRSLAKTADVDVAGRRMADVVSEIRARSLRDVPGPDTDATGLPSKWGPDPALLGDAVFPDGAKLHPREQTAEVGDTERYSSTDLLRVAPASGSGTFRHAATLEETQRMTGDLVNAGTVVTNLNTIFIDDQPFVQADPTLAQTKRYRAAISPTGNAARFYECNLVLATNASRDCVAIGDGSYAFATQGDARVLRFTAGYPAKLITGAKRQRQYVERSGGVFGGYKDLERKHFGVRPNTVAWEALRGALGIPALPAVAAPAGPGPFATLRSFTFNDASNYNFRFFTGDASVLDAQGFFLADEVRETRTGGNLVPFNRNALYWNGSSWSDCGNSGIGVNRVNSVAPFNSDYCNGSFLDDRASQVTVTLNGSRMSDVVNNIRFYSSKDGAFDYANWGPNPSANPQLATTFFPAGSTLEYRGNLRRATPLVLHLGPNDKVRVPPADTSVPFNTWPFATSLEEWIAKNPGDLLGGPLNGATAFFVTSTTLPSAPEGFTNQLQWRVAFDANGQKARFYNNNLSASTGFTTNYVALLDTTYTIETIGGKRVLKFAAMPAGFERDLDFARMFAEHDGALWYASKQPTPATPVHSIRLNGTAADALLEALGVN